MAGKRLPILVLILMSLPQSGWAEGSTLSFSDVWRAVKTASPSQKAANAGREAAEISRDRSARHWFPRLFLDARAYSTDDPAQTFFALLGERQASATDFVPSTLNQPGSDFFTQGSIGLDMPLFEGGAKVAQHKAMESAAQAKALSAQAVSTEDYVNSARLYGSLLALRDQGRRLSDLQKAVESILQRYRLGAKGNPVGYSGLLGLKGLRNRLEAAIGQNEEQSRASQESLSEMAGGLPQQWDPKQQEFLEFVNENLPLQKRGAPGESVSVKSAQMMARSLEKAAEGEKAKFLPKVGLFADEMMVNGSRGSGTSYSAGAYLQWSIFSATDYGSIREAQLKSAEASAGADARALGERMEKSQARHSELASEQAIRLLNENVDLLTEQTESSRKLYQSGAINALQFVEVLSRRADLLGALSEAQLALLSARATEIKTSEFEVPHE